MSSGASRLNMARMAGPGFGLRIWKWQLGEFCRPKAMEKRARGPYKAPMTAFLQNARPGQRFRGVRCARKPSPMDGRTGQGHRRPPFRRRLRHRGVIRPGSAERRCQHRSSTMPTAREVGILLQRHALRRPPADGRARAGAGQAIHAGRPAGLQRCRQGTGDGGHGRAQAGLAASAAGRRSGHRRTSPWMSAAPCWRPAPCLWAIPIACCSCRMREPAPVTELGPRIETHGLFPEPHQCRIRPGAGPAAHPHAGVGARRGRNPGLRHRRLRHRGGGRPARAWRTARSTLNWTAANCSIEWRAGATIMC